MGLLSHIFSFATGIYAGAFIAQNYEMPKLSSPSEIDSELVKEAVHSSLQSASQYLDEYLQIPVVPSIQEAVKKLEDQFKDYKKRDQ